MVYLMEAENENKKAMNPAEKVYQLKKEIRQRLGEQKLLLPETGGYLIPEENEQTLKFQQDQLKDLLPYGNTHNVVFIAVIS